MVVDNPGNSTTLLKVDRVAEKVWAISSPAHDLMYLVAGESRAMLVDTGMGFGDLAAVVRSLTGLPLAVVNTHGHPDHAGGNANFDEVWLDLRDEAFMRTVTTDEFRLEDLKRARGQDSPEYRLLAESLVPDRPYQLHALQPGQVFDLGGRSFEVVPIPGHTPGSVGLLDSREKMLFAGDSIVATPVWMYLEHSTSLSIYLASLKKVWERRAEFETIFPGHMPTPLGKAHLEDLIACAEEILAGIGVGEPDRTFAGEGLRWQHGSGIIIYDPGRLK